MATPITLPDLQQAKHDGRKIVGVVAWDYQIARVADRAGADIISVGDSVGVNLWGHTSPLEVTMEEMIIVAKAVRRGAKRALISCDFPFGPLQESTTAAVRAAIRIVKETGADLVKLDGASDFPEAVTAIARAGIPIFAQFGLTPQTALRHGVSYEAQAGAPVPESMTDALISEAKTLAQAGASLLNFTNSGPVVGPRVAQAVSIPVLGGFGGGPWLDGRIRMAHAAIGYAASTLDQDADRYADVARLTLDALTAYADDVRSGRQIKGGIPTTPAS